MAHAVFSGRLASDASMRVDDGGNPCIGGTNQRQPLLDGAQTRLVQMLVGSGRGAEPGVVCQVQQPARPASVARHALGKYRFIADQRRDRAARPECVISGTL